MLSSDCNVCHGGTSRFPVRLNSSDGGTNFDPISCLGCHGRAEPAAGNAITGAGLRQHHFRNGVTLCGTSGCHTDADPASFTTVGENVAPPYYFTPDGSHPNKPKDPCNTDGSESAVAPSMGLDNDGDNVYDEMDTNCGATGVPISPNPPGLSLANVVPNPAPGQASCRFTLSRDSIVGLAVLDIQGRVVRTIYEGDLGAGTHDIAWDGRGDGGDSAPPGLYFIRLNAEGRIARKKFVLLR